MTKIYLDNCCYNRPFDSQDNLYVSLETQAKLSIQEDVLAQKYLLEWSFILEYENAYNRDITIKNTIEKWKYIARHITLSSNEIINLANELTKIGIKNKDALHIACACNAKCDFFITTDKKILNKNVKNITLIDPINFIKNRK